MERPRRLGDVLRGAVCVAALTAAGIAGCGGGGGGSPAATASSTPATFSSLAEAAGSGFSEPGGLAVSHDGHRLYFSARRQPDDAAGIYVVDLTTQQVSQLYGGGPLVEPSAIAVTPDDRTLLIADLAADTGGQLSGTVFSLPASGASGPTPVLPPDAIDMPGGLALDRTGARVFVSGYTADGVPAIFSMSPDGGKLAVLTQGAPLTDPGTLAIAPDQQSLVLIDNGAASDGGATLFRLTVDKPAFQTLATGLAVGYPAGLSSDSFGTEVYITGQSPTTGRPAVLGVSTADGHAVRTLYAGGPDMQPGGLAQSPLTAAVLYVADADPTSGGIATIYK